MADRDYKKEYRDYHGRPEQIKRRSARNKSRQILKDADIDVAGKDVDHKDHNPRMPGQCQTARNETQI